MEKVVHIYKLGEEPSAVSYWSKQPPIERIRALEAIRHQYNSWKYGTEQGLQRVARVVQRSSKSCHYKSRSKPLKDTL